MANKPKILDFKCPACGRSLVQCVKHNVISKATIICINDDGDFDYQKPTIRSEGIEHFECLYCGYIITSNGHKITIASELIEWVKRVNEAKNE
ncbi:hypothetical protein LCGC14_1518950 [marine sediment metagenome]|uniref:Uncharacterized protein n=1 Tax=marine sediment metagenome TaxID=412755 RepID=A0A0F9M0B3_9ZZZZ